MVHLEEGTVRALSPQALGARLVLAVGLVDLQVLHLQRQRKKKTKKKGFNFVQLQDVTAGGRGGRGGAHPL